MDVGGRRIRAEGPDWNQGWPWDRQNWAVSFEVFTPWNTDLNLKARNGAVTVSDVRGRIDLDTRNGGVRLTRVAGDVSGETRNGGIEVELDGNAWEGRSLDLRTRNGGVTLVLPQSYSASIQMETNRGEVESDFPISIGGRFDRRSLSFNIGSGGPPVRISTRNGGVRLRRR
jgi:DUF4097 and DUF4098 domain-containing protein YvlB